MLKTQYKTHFVDLFLSLMLLLNDLGCQIVTMKGFSKTQNHILLKLFLSKNIGLLENCVNAVVRLP